MGSLARDPRSPPHPFYYEDRDGNKRRMVLATNLTDTRKYERQELAAIYTGRWDIELQLHDVKTTLQMEWLRVKTPDSARKTLAMSQIAYNLIKPTANKRVIRAKRITGRSAS